MHQYVTKPNGADQAKAFRIATGLMNDDEALKELVRVCIKYEIALNKYVDNTFDDDQAPAAIGIFVAGMVRQNKQLTDKG